MSVSRCVCDTASARVPYVPVNAIFKWLQTFPGFLSPVWDPSRLLTTSSAVTRRRSERGGPLILAAQCAFAGACASSLPTSLPLLLPPARQQVLFPPPFLYSESNLCGTIKIRIKMYHFCLLPASATTSIPCCSGGSYCSFSMHPRPKTS